MTAVFVPIDDNQLDEVLNAALGYRGFSDVALASVACREIGVDLIKQVSEVWLEEKPANDNHHRWLKGWMCEVKPRQTNGN